MFLTIIAASLDPAAECSPAFRFIDNDPPRGWLRQETVHCNKIAPQCQLTADIASVALTGRRGVPSPPKILNIHAPEIAWVPPETMQQLGSLAR